MAGVCVTDGMPISVGVFTPHLACVWCHVYEYGIGSFYACIKPVL